MVGRTNRHRSLKGGFVWRYFWGSHQRFFRDLCIASKVPATIEQAQQALDNDKVTWHSFSALGKGASGIEGRGSASLFLFLCGGRG